MNTLDNIFNVSSHAETMSWTARHCYHTMSQPTDHQKFTSNL